MDGGSQGVGDLVELRALGSKNKKGGSVNPSALVCHCLVLANLVEPGGIEPPAIPNCKGELVLRIKPLRQRSGAFRRPRVNPV